MADRSALKNNLRYHRIIVIGIVLIYIWVQYDYSSRSWNYTNGTPKAEGEKINGRDEGIWTWYYENRKVQMQSMY